MRSPERVKVVALCAVFAAAAGCVESPGRRARRPPMPSTSVANEFVESTDLMPPRPQQDAGAPAGGATAPASATTMATESAGGLDVAGAPTGAAVSAGGEPSPKASAPRGEVVEENLKTIE